MKTDLTTLGSYNQSRALGKKEVANKDTLKAVDPNLLKNKPTPDYKVDLASRAPSSPGAPSLPSLPSVDTPPVPDVSSPTKELVKEEAKNEAKKEIKKEIESKEIKEVKDGSVKKPAIFFIKGLDVFSSPSKSESGYAGVGRIADAVEGSRMYGWDQKDEIIKQIKKTHPDYPVILVGHSFGGDTAVDIANALDSLEHKFRPIDLLVTIDAIGFNNDIIPQNVKKHLNIFGEHDWFLNDGPHVARRNEMTSVMNILSPLKHTELDDDKELQYEMVKLIQETLKNRA